jgi:hypothetical protein
VRVILTVRRGESFGRHRNIATRTSAKCAAMSIARMAAAKRGALITVRVTRDVRQNQGCPGHEYAPDLALQAQAVVSR